MAQKKICNPHNCFLVSSVNVIGGKWKVLVLYQIQQNQPVRFGELQKRLNGITQAVLTAQLRELEADGLVSREVFAEVPPRVEYRLTALGEAFQPVFAAMADWGKQYNALAKKPYASVAVAAG